MNKNEASDGATEETLLAERAIDTGDRYCIARLVSLFEDPRPHAFAVRDRVIRALQETGRNHRATLYGITGSPGVGKSTLAGEIATELARIEPTCRVAVLAVDPSSEISGGALLGDRTRVHFPPDEPRLYFRSQASRREVGGISRSTFSVCRLLYYLFDYVLIETVGTGQNEIDIRHVADRVYLVLQPLGGDQIQFMKAGIMEIPDVIVINKWDREDLARATFHSLKTSPALLRPGDEPPVFRVSALTGYGLEELVRDFRAFREAHTSIDDGSRTQTGLRKKEGFHFAKWVKEEWGRRGTEILRERGGADRLIEERGFDLAQQDFVNER